ncbi:hypothetical protein [Candidatus Xianfuyuplasma coldseepsis]|uniref:Uncharacterized protein n=1 Tax=Candidatus Xianfuyuplasma coldseepsis TaxID=2782163 RepID=A0A7L7KSJ5_9MOLU|nr:hypothetical protein [Xianfuyuplasma coldseepsis]QMS85791.1 hypothetical protein G4Z02_08545 [Xianfuyuplasma coldseepsis]
MQSKYGVLTWVFIIVFGVAVTLLYQGISMVTSMETIPLEVDETTVVSIPEDGEYYFMYEHDWNVRYFILDQLLTYMEFETESGDYRIGIYNKETDEPYFIEPLAENSSITINNRQVGGRIDFDAGDYDISIVPINTTGEYAAFYIATTGIVGGILLIVFSSLVSLASFILFIVFYSKRRKLLDMDVDFDGYTYQSQNDNDLYDIEDDFFNKRD